MVTSSDMMQVSEMWIRILNKIDAMEKCPKDFGSGDLLHCSEIHTLMGIGMHKDITVTELAGFLGISKSAISQMITRLVEKNLVEKHQNPKNGKEIFLRLSAKGMVAYLGHEQYHAKMFALMGDKLGPMNEEQFMFLSKILHAVEETVDEFLQGN